VERKTHACGTLTERISRFWSFLRVDLAPRVAASLQWNASDGLSESIPDHREAFLPFEDVWRVEHRCTVPSEILSELLKL